MGRIIKLLLLLAVLGFAGLAGYAYFGLPEPDMREISVPVILDAN
ncbi:hypothetical protein [Gemmobacter lutimaris]|nr:hypothetical protein [Gemmobacter lutimaris]